MSTAAPLYRQFFTAAEIAALDSTPALSAASEIALIRVLIVRVLAASESGEPASRNQRREPLPRVAPARRRLAQRPRNWSVKRQLEVFAAFCRAALTLASLVRFEHKYNVPPNPLFAAMAELENEPL